MEEKKWLGPLKEALQISVWFAGLVTFVMASLILYEPFKDFLLATSAARVTVVLVCVATLLSGPIVLVLSGMTQPPRIVSRTRTLVTRLPPEAILFVCSACLLSISLVVGRTGCVESWKRVEGPWVGEVGPIVFNPQDPDIVYAVATSRGSSYSTLLRSMDAGGTWKVLGTERLAPVRIGALAVDPDSPETMYVGTRGQGILKSTNAGLSWSAVNRGLASYDVRALSIAAGDPAVILAGTAGTGGAGGVYRSEDGAASWALTNLMDKETEAFGAHPEGALLAGTDYGLYRSTDRGEAWQLVGEGMPMAHILSLAVDATSETVFAGAQLLGVFRSVDGGIGWSNVGLGGFNVQVLAVDQSDPVVVYAGTFGRGGGGLHRSTDRGITWTEIGGALGGQAVSGIAVSPSDPQVVLAGTSAGIFRSVDRGRTWSRSEADLKYSEVNTIAIPHDSPSALLAGTSGGVFRTTDGGQNWVAANVGLRFTDVRTLVIDPLNPSTLYAGVFARGMAAVVYGSTDSGTTWGSRSQGIHDDDVRALAASAANPGTVYAGTFGSGIFKTFDGGVTWASLPQVGNLKVLDIALVGGDPELLYIGTDGDGVFRSRDGGESWTAISAGLVFRSVPEIAVVPGAPWTLYVATRGGGVYRSTDEGDSWTPVSTGLANTEVLTLAVDSVDPQMLYVGTDGGGVYRSTDAGQHWTALNDGLASGRVRALVIARSVPARVYAATNRGIFELVVVCH